MNLPVLLLAALLAVPAGAAEPGARIDDAAARQALTARPGREELRRRLETVPASASLTGLAVRGRRLFYLKQEASAQRPTLIMRQGSDPPHLVLDASEFGRDAAQTLGWWTPSPDGLLLAYGVLLPATGEVELRVRETDSGLDLPDRISRAAEASVAWLPDRTGFYYTRGPAPGAAPPVRAVRFHLMGTDPALDETVFPAPAPGVLPQARTSKDGRLLLISLNGDGREDWLVRPRTDQTAAWMTVRRGPPSRAAALDGAELYLLTDEAAPRGRILAADLRQPRKPRWREALPQGPLPVTDFTLAAGAVAAAVTERGTSRLQVFGRSGRPLREIPLPEQTGLSSLAADPGRRELYFVWESYYAGAGLQRFDLARSSLTTVDSAPGLDPDEYRLREVLHTEGALTLWQASSRWLRRDGTNPVLLALPDACGGVPRYSPELAAWLRLGGIALWPARSPCPEDAAALAKAAGSLVAWESSRPGLLAAAGTGRGAALAAAVARRSPKVFGALVMDQPGPVAPDASLPPTLVLSGPCPGGESPDSGRRFTGARPGTLLLWEPLGCSDLPASRRRGRILDLYTFLHWRLGIERPRDVR